MGPSAVSSSPPSDADWCGSVGTEWVPDGALGVDWSGACEAHDECYDTLGASKLLCDYTLQQDMSLACTAQNGGLLCQVIAGLYYDVVRTQAGERAFDLAQAAAAGHAP